MGLAALLALTGAADHRLGRGRRRSTTSGSWPRVRAQGQGLVGAIVGKALYEGRFDVAEAVAACGDDTAVRIPARPGSGALERRR